eukprot:UN16340
MEAHITGSQTLEQSILGLKKELKRESVSASSLSLELDAAKAESDRMRETLEKERRKGEALADERAKVARLER